MIQVDVENNSVRFCAEAIPLYEPLLQADNDVANKKRDVAWGRFLLSVATFSTIVMVFFLALCPTDAGLDSLSNNSTNSTSVVFPFEMAGPFDWIDNFSSPQFQAMEWMAGHHVETTAMLERFALVTLFITTQGSRWKVQFEFLSKTKSICEWNDGQKGAFCDEKHHSVTKLLLDGLNLEGTVPQEIVYLTNLQVLNLENNHLDGELPLAMASMESLGEIALQGNRPGFARNVNDALCDGISDSKFEILAMGDDCPLPVCLCCTDCPH